MKADGSGVFGKVSSFGALPVPWTGAGPSQSVSPFVCYPECVPKWCTVTVTDGDGKRYSLDVQAESSYDAAHLFHAHVKANPTCGFPIPTTATLFEVVAAGRIHRVSGVRLKTWIENRRREWKGPRGRLFNERPMIGD